MLLLIQAYGFILSVSQEINNNSKAINGERHLSACQVQDAIKALISNSDQRLKASATVIAKSLTLKVLLTNHIHMRVHVCFTGI